RFHGNRLNHHLAGLPGAARCYRAADGAALVMSAEQELPGRDSRRVEVCDRAQNERRLRRVALRCLVPRRGSFRRVAVRARGARAICFLCAVGPYVPACAVLRYGRALAVSERGSPTLVKNHWQPNRNARRRIVFLLEQIVVRGKDALVGLPLLLF